MVIKMNDIKWKVKDDFIYVAYKDRYFKSKKNLNENYLEIIVTHTENCSLSKFGYFRLYFGLEKKNSIYSTDDQWFQKIDKRDFVKIVIR